jgi:hypothetical protein
MPFPFPYLYCPKCKERTYFPFPSPQEPTSHQPRLPSDTWRIYFVCSQCVQLSVLTAKDVQMVFPDKGFPDRWGVSPSFFRVRHRCGHKDCATPVTVFVATRKIPLSDRTANDVVFRSYPKPLCPSGHVLTQDGALVSVTEVFSLL